MLKDHQETERFLAVRYPHIKNARVLLEKINAILGIFDPINGGNIETSIRWSQGTPQWDDINIHFRELMRDESRAK